MTSADTIFLCPCTSGLTYNQCCKRLHDGVLPENALQLMRSRYAAYALNNIDYIIATTHPKNPNYIQDKALWKSQISKFRLNSTFDKLTILEFKENKNVATVTFTAYITQNAQDATFTEKSSFEKIGDQWLYLNGIITK